MNFEKVTIHMEADEFVRMKALMERDKMRPYIAVKGKLNNGESYCFGKCPVCENVLLDDSNFCRFCGQRVDMKNEAL